MKIAVIGSGAAGLATTWLLDPQHEVTLYDKEDRLGGHAHTIDVTVGDQVIGIEGGFEFFSEVMFPTFKRLLQLLAVPVTPFAMTATLWDTRTGYSYVLPPFRDGRIYLEGLTPRKTYDMLRFQGVVRASRDLMQRQDTSITVTQFFEQIRLPEDFQSRFMYPYLQAQWGVSREQVASFSTYNALRYSFLNRFEGLSAWGWQEVEGGTRRYVQALCNSLTHAQIRRSTNIQRICPMDGGYTVLDDKGPSERFDQVVLATNANQAGVLIADIPELAEMRALLNSVTYFETTIALHGDTRLMPPVHRHWSVANLRFDGRYSQFSMYKKWKSKGTAPLFKSWITHDSRLPDRLYATVKYLHPQVDLAYFHAQEVLQRYQGQHNLWLAGMYMHDVDCHESAVMSGVKVAQRLAPDSPRLRQLMQTDPGGG